MIIVEPVSLKRTNRQRKPDSILPLSLSSAARRWASVPAVHRLEGAENQASQGRQGQSFKSVTVPRVLSKTVWRITLLLNLVLMVVLGIASSWPMMKLQNVRQYPESYPEAYRYPGSPWPSISKAALQVSWLVGAIPLLWAVLTIILTTRKWQPDRARDVVALHTSATLFVGLTMLFFFLIAAILPFDTYYVGYR